jgi:predicted DNA-binding transcriptional regulator AlpA
MNDLVDPILTEEEYTAWLNLSAPTAQRQRSDGSGPPFIQLSERRIGYRKSAVERWLESRTITRVGALGSRTRGSEPAAQKQIGHESDDAGATASGKTARSFRA